MGLGPFPPHLHSSLYLPKKTEKLINDVTTLSFLLSTVFCYLYSILSSTNTLPTTTRGLYIGPCTPQTLCLLFHPIISYHSLPTNKKMSNTSSIEELIPQLPSELQLEIRNRCIASRARQVLALCDHILQLEYNFGLINQFPNLEYPWNTPVYFREPVPWTPIFYVYLWYLFNNYHMPLLFKPDYFLSWGSSFWFDYTLFDKFWNQVFGEDWRVVASGNSTNHPLPYQRRSRRLLHPKTYILIVKFNSSQDDVAAGIRNLSTLEWVRNANGSFHGHHGWHSDVVTTCQTTIWRASFLNTGIEYNPEDLASSPDVYYNQDEI